jgi:ankyrin repeat protein
MRALIAGGADTTKPITDATTPLMAAAGLKEGNARDADRRGLSLIDGGKVPDGSRILETVALALQSGDVNAANKNGDTAMHAAATMNYDSVIKLLAEKGANLNTKNSRGLTPLAALTGGRNRQATENSRNSTIELLRKLGGTE